MRQRLAGAVDSVTSAPSLAVFGYVPDSIPEPAFVVGEVEINPNNSFGGFDEARVTCYVLTGRQDDRAGQKLLDQFLSRTGAASVRAAILAARGAPGSPALSGAADDLNIESISGYRFYRFGDVPYYGAAITVKVVGS